MENEHDISQLLNEIKPKEGENGYIECSESSGTWDDHQYYRILSAIEKCLKLLNENNNLKKDNEELKSLNESISARLRHLLESKTIASYDEMKNDKYSRNIKDIDSFMNMTHPILCEYVINNGLNRIGDFKVLKNKENSLFIYDPIPQKAKLNITIIDDTDDGICPICKNKIGKYPAISRKDNKTKICSNCGVQEALEAFKGSVKSDEEKI